MGTLGLRSGSMMLLGALLACATPNATRLPVGGGFGFGSPSSPERIDACAGALIALRGAAGDLRADLDETRNRKLVWRGERNTLRGKAAHQVDWNPVLDYLAVVLDQVDGWISTALTTAASAHAAPSSRDEDALKLALTRSGETLHLAGVYLAAIRAAQYALHDAPAYATGGLGFNDGVIDRVERLRRALDALRSGADPGQLAPEANEAVGATTSYIDSYCRGIQDGAKLMQVAEVIAIVNVATGTVKALAGMARLLAGATVEAGGLTYALAGAGAGGGGAGAAAAAGASTAGIQAVLAGVAVTTAALGTVSYRGGKQPNDVGKDGEHRAGFSGPKERIPSLTGTAKYRVPDRVTKLTIEEVKNVLQLSNSNQLRDYFAYARRTKRTFVLVIRRATVLSEELERYAAQGLIQIERIL
jgi:restriction endonuclease fold toxin 7 of polymorphic toxin system